MSVSYAKSSRKPISWQIVSVFQREKFTQLGDEYEIDVVGMKPTRTYDIPIEFRISLVQKNSDLEGILVRFSLLKGTKTTTTRTQEMFGCATAGFSIRFSFPPEVVESQIVNGCLSVGVSILKPSEIPQGDLLRKMFCWVQSERFGDVDIVSTIDGHRRRGYKRLLSLGSEVFQQMFSSEPQKKLVEIDSFTGDIVAQLIFYTHIGQVDPTEQNVAQLYAAAHNYRLKEENFQLKFTLEKLMVDSLTLDSLVESIDIAVKYDLKKLMTAVKNFLIKFGSQLPVDDRLALIQEFPQLSSYCRMPKFSHK